MQDRRMDEQVTISQVHTKILVIVHNEMNDLVFYVK